MTLNRNISDSSIKESGFSWLFDLRGIIGDIKNDYYTLGFFRVEIVKWYNSNGGNELGGNCYAKEDTFAVLIVISLFLCSSAVNKAIPPTITTSLFR